jgi:hypothetical protein
MHNKVYEIVDKPARRGFPNPVSIPDVEGSLSGVAVGQGALGGETDHSIVEFTSRLNRQANRGVKLTSVYRKRYCRYILRVTSTSTSTSIRVRSLRSNEGSE